MSSWRFIATVSLLLAVLVAGVLFYAVGKSVDQPLLLKEQQIITIERRQTFYHLLQALRAREFLESTFLLKVHARIYGTGEKIFPGEYLLKPGDSVQDLLIKIANGDVRRYRITLIEGQDIGSTLIAMKDDVKLVQSLNSREDLAEVIKFQFDADVSEEGLFFPDTYFFQVGDSDVDILQRAHQRLVDVLHEEWANRSKELPYKTPYEALIMASIIEKETGVAAEREKIAGVFVRRLQKKMRLQTDPTVIYGLGDNYQGNLKRRHLLDKSNSYNTYAHRGLPPTPIGMAGREAIHAALHPADGDALFFVAKGDGSHYFSETLAEHENAVQKYQIQSRRRDYRSSPLKKSGKG